MATVAGISTEGFTVLHDAEDAIADIVFIHGLQGHPYMTWSCPRIATGVARPRNKSRQRRPVRTKSIGLWCCLCHTLEEEDSGQSGDEGSMVVRTGEPDDQGVYWPRDLLGKEKWCASARVMTYGYDSKVTRGFANTNKNNIFAHAKDLLYSLQREKPSRRPIVFVVHSLGGVILKEILRRSEASEEQELRDIVQSTAGIIFLGTPHRGSPGLAGLGEAVRRTASMIVRLDTNSTLLRSLGTDSPELELGRESFLVLWRTYNFRVKTFQEAFGISGVNIGPANEKVVPDISSTLDDPREHAETISANHMNMCRFTLPSDPGYRKVSHEIKIMLASCQEEPEITRHGRGFLQSLYFPQMYDRQKNIQKALSDTCNWLFSSTQYRNWINRVGISDHHGLLWIKGKPGSGKSTLMKEALRRAHSKYDGTLTSTAAFFFNARGTQQLEKTPLGLFRSLLHQVLQQDTRALGHLSSAYQRKAVFQPSVTWHQEELQEFLISVFATSVSRPAVLFIDAMDECDDDEVRDLVKFFSKLTKQAFSCGARLNVCVSSRHYPHISIDDCPELVVEHHNRQDILLFIVAEAEDHHLIKDLKQDIFQKSEGVFLWVVLVISILKKSGRGKSLKWLRNKLSEIPRELATLFSGLFGAVEQYEATRTVHLMQLILFAHEPLTLDEIHSALGFSLTSFESFEAWRDSVDYLETARTKHEMIVELSRGLLEPTPSTLGVKHSSGSQTALEDIEETKTTYQFIHETVREFFISGDGFKLLGFETSSVDGSGHQTIAMACVRYLDTRELSMWAISGLKPSTQSLSKKYCFVIYTAHWLLYHIEAAEEHGVSQEITLSLIRDRELLRCFQRFGTDLSGSIRPFVSDGASLLYAAAEIGVLHVVKRLINMGYNVNGGCAASRRYPLLAAVAGTKHWHRPNSDWVVSFRGPSSELVQLLLDCGADVSLRNKYKQSALHIAVTTDAATVRAILSHNPGINARDMDKDTPLHRAGLSHTEHKEEIVDALLERGADVNARNTRGNIPLLNCVVTGFLSLPSAKAFVRGGSQLDARNNKKDTILLCLASQSRRTGTLDFDMYNYIVEAGADQTAVGGDGLTAGEMLRQAGFRVNSKTGFCEGRQQDKSPSKS
ncbi:hypothetical protein F4779DRAFT_111214 [Xylariaceae sp. FL0662B]|nr:hypothetical protein F4779DRAFT_111214 [Xylariaceae sp. FL0662B]